MRKFAGILMSAALVLPAAVLLGQPAGAAGGTSCKTGKGSATFTPPLPKLGSPTKVKDVLKSKGTLAGCSGAVKSATITGVSPKSTGSNCTTIANTKAKPDQGHAHDQVEQGCGVDGRGPALGHQGQARHEPGVHRKGHEGSVRRPEGGRQDHVQDPDRSVRLEAAFERHLHRPGCVHHQVVLRPQVVEGPTVAAVGPFRVPGRSSRSRTVPCDSRRRSVVARVSFSAARTMTDATDTGNKRHGTTRCEPPHRVDVTNLSGGGYEEFEDEAVDRRRPGGRVARRHVGAGDEPGRGGNGQEVQRGEGRRALAVVRQRQARGHRPAHDGRDLHVARRRTAGTSVSRTRRTTGARSAARSRPAASSSA